MLIPLLFAVVSAALLARAYRDREYLRTFAGAPSEEHGGSLTATDIYGQSVTLDTSIADRFVVFEWRSGQSQAELDYWQNVKRSLPTQTELIGICPDSGCGTQLRQERLTFPIVSYGSYTGLSALLERDKADRVVVAGPQGQVLASLSNNVSPEKLVAALTEAIHETRH